MCQPAKRAVYVPGKHLTAQGQNNLPGQQAPIRFQMSQEFFFRHKALQYKSHAGACVPVRGSFEVRPAAHVSKG